MMHLLKKVFLIVSTLPVVSYAAITKCTTADQNPFNAQLISWDDQKNKAEVITGFGEKFEGSVLNSRKYGNAQKVNIYIKYKKQYLNSDAVEYTIFPISDTELGVSSVQYIFKKRKQLLEAVNENHVLKCKVENP